MNDQEGYESCAPGGTGQRYLRRGGWRKRLTSRFAVALAAVTVVGTVSGSPSPAGPPLEQLSTTAKSAVVNLTWWTMWSGTTLQLLNQMVTQFNKTHPGIHVTETNIPSTQRRAPPSCSRRSRRGTRRTSSRSGGRRSAPSPPTATS